MDVRRVALASAVAGSLATVAVVAAARSQPPATPAIRLSSNVAVTVVTAPPETTTATAGPARVATGPQVAVGNESTTAVEVRRGGGGVTVTNSGTAVADTGGNRIGDPGGTVATGAASATGNRSAVVVTGP